MKIKKSTKLDVAYIQLRKGKVSETIEIRPGVLADLDKSGELLGVEILSTNKLAPQLEHFKKKTA